MGRHVQEWLTIRFSMTETCEASAIVTIGRLVLAALLLGSAQLPARGDTPTVSPVRRLPNLPLGSRCFGTLPCAASGDYGVHLRALGVLALVAGCRRNSDNDNGGPAQQPARTFPTAITFGLMAPRCEGHAIHGRHVTLGERAKNLIIG